MKTKEIETYKFRAESLRQIGLILCTPFAMTIFRILIYELKLIETFKDIKTYISCLLFLLGFIIIDRAVSIMNFIKEELK